MKMLVYRLLVCLCFVTISQAKLNAQVTRGFDRKVPAVALNAEISRQPSLWVMEVQLKPMRMIWVDMKNPATGQQERQEVWYLVWRAINRPLKSDNSGDTKAVNRTEPLPGEMQFIPKFTLVTYDNPDNEIPVKIHPDQILPAAVKAIEKVERVALGQLNNTVSAVQDVPGLVSADEEEQPWIYGVATWVGVDPKTDFFKVMLHGFSNGYENRSQDAENPELWRKVIVQRFYRPGDEFDPDLKEFQYVEEPEWTYQPDAAKVQ